MLRKFRKLEFFKAVSIFTGGFGRRGSQRVKRSRMIYILLHVVKQEIEFGGNLKNSLFSYLQCHFSGH